MVLGPNMFDDPEEGVGGGRLAAPPSAMKADRRALEPRPCGPLMPGSGGPLIPGPWQAPAPARYGERYASPGQPERRLRLLLVGHNPSQVAWSGGHFYGNPTNRMWSLLADRGLIPGAWSVPADERMPAEVGIGFTDVGCEPGNDASSYGRAVMRRWRAGLWLRLRAHVLRVMDPGLVDPEMAWDGAGVDAAIEARWAELPDGAVNLLGPAVVAFTGKRQWVELFDARPSGVEFGLQSPLVRPAGWPLGEAEVWVLPSSSGRAAMTAEARLGPYRALGARLAQVPWPL